MYQPQFFQAPRPFQPAYHPTFQPSYQPNYYTTNYNPYQRQIVPATRGLSPQRFAYTQRVLPQQIAPYYQQYAPQQVQPFTNTRIAVSYLPPESRYAPPYPNIMNSPTRIVNSPPRVSPPRVRQYSPSKLTVSYASPNRSQYPIFSPPRYHTPAAPTFYQATGAIILQPHANWFNAPKPIIQQNVKPPQSAVKVVPNIAPQQASPIRKQDSPQQKASEQKANKDELDKRYNEALDRTKKIVEKFDKERISPNKSDEGDVPAPVPEQNDDDEDPDEQGNLEDLALQYEDGYIYRGQGLPPQTRQGFGVLVDGDENEVYAGFWEDNQYNGEGRLNNLNVEQLYEPVEWADMTSIGNGWVKYEGEFKHGKMQGKGVLTLSNGEIYQGEFFDGMVHGNGTFTTTSKERIEGRWQNGYLEE